MTITASVILFFVAMFNATNGLDLKKFRGWFFVFCGFLAGFLYGLGDNKDLINSTGAGLFISLLTIIAGLSHLLINRWLSKHIGPHND